VIDISQANGKTWTVQLGISANENIKSEITSFLNRELRSLGDINVVESDPDYIIQVVALETKLQGSTYVNGVAISIVITKPLDVDLLKIAIEVLKPKSDTAVESFLDYYFHEFKYERILQQFIQIGPKDNLRSLCESIIATFDSDIMIPARDSQYKLDEYIRTLEAK
jgi:hypothetical protein